MNFHISNLSSPLRPQFPSSSLGASRPQPSPRLPSLDEPTNNHDTTGSGPVRIAVEPADELPSYNIAGSDIDDTDASSSSASSSASSDVSADDVTQDSRDVLVQRLTDLAERIGAANVRTSCIEALHKQVDEMERISRGNSRHRSSSRKSHSSAASAASSSSRQRAPSFQPGSRPRSLQLPMGHHSSHDSSRGRDSLGVMAPMSPSWFMSRFQRSRPSVHHEEAERPGHVDRNEDSLASEERLGSAAPSATRKPEISSSHQRPPVERISSLDANTNAHDISSQVAEDAIKEAEKLCAEMATVIESLQTRRQESDHLQTVLVKRKEMAHKRLLNTSLITGELEDVVADNEAELRHLRLELRAIEVQCMGYVPKDADPDLKQSIRNWKEDWLALREKYAVRKGSSFVSGDDSSTACSVSASPMSQRL